MRQFVPKAVATLLACASISCKSRPFNEPRGGSSVKSATNARLVLSTFKPSADYGAGYALGIPFKAPDASVVASFTKTHAPTDDTAANLLAKLGSPTDKVDWKSPSRSDPINSNTFGLLTVPDPAKQAAIEKALQPLLQAYFNQVSKWMSLKCFDVDVAENKDLVVTGFHKFEKDRGALTCSFADLLGAEALGQVFTEGLKFSFPETRKLGDPNTRKLHWDFSEEGKTSFYTVGLFTGASGDAPILSIQTTPDVTVGTKTVPGPSVSLAIVGDYLLPLHTWSLSKTTPVPVMKIERQGNTLVPGAFHDFGLIVLNSLDDEARLVSVVSTRDALSWKAGTPPTVGNLSHLFPERYGSTLTPSDKAEITESIAEKGKIERMVGSTAHTLDHLWPKTERLEIGAIHLTIDARYGALSHRDSRNVVVLKGVDWAKVKADYLAINGSPATVHINTLDTLGLQALSTRSKVRPVLDDQAAACAQWGTTPSRTPGIAIETEIIMGGDWPEKFLGAMNSASGTQAQLTVCPP